MGKMSYYLVLGNFSTVQMSYANPKCTDIFSHKFHKMIHFFLKWVHQQSKIY